MRTLAVLFRLWKANLLSALEYRASFLMQAGFMAVNDAFWLFVWWLAFHRFGTFAGMDFRGYLLLFSLGTIFFGWVHVFFNGYSDIPKTVSTGALDSRLLLPFSPYLSVLASSMSVSALGDLAFGIGILPFVPGMTWGLAASVVALSFLSAAVVLGYLAAAHSLVFWIGPGRGFYSSVFETVIGAGLYPPGTYEKSWMRAVFMTVIPAWFVMTIPMRLISGLFSWEGLLAVFAAAVFWNWLAATLFRRGLRRYESGSGMTANG